MATNRTINGTGTTTNQLADGVNIRRGRLSVEGSYFKDLGYRFEYDFVRAPQNGSSAGTADGITDAYMTWKHIKMVNTQRN